MPLDFSYTADGEIDFDGDGDPTTPAYDYNALGEIDFDGDATPITSAYNRTGSGSIAYSGSGQPWHFSLFYTGIGSITYAGAGHPTPAYSPHGRGVLAFSGVAGHHSDYAFIPKGLIRFNYLGSQFDTSQFWLRQFDFGFKGSHGISEPHYLRKASGSLAYSGAATSTHFEHFHLVGSGGLALAGHDTSKPHYYRTASGSLALVPRHATSTVAYSRSTSGSIEFSFIGLQFDNGFDSGYSHGYTGSRATVKPHYLRIASGSLAFTGSMPYARGFDIRGSGSLAFAGHDTSKPHYQRIAKGSLALATIHAIAKPIYKALGRGSEGLSGNGHYRHGFAFDASGSLSCGSTHGIGKPRYQFLADGGAYSSAFSIDFDIEPSIPVTFSGHGVDRVAFKLVAHRTAIALSASAKLKTYFYSSSGSIRFAGAAPELDSYALIGSGFIRFLSPPQAMFGGTIATTPRFCGLLSTQALFVGGVGVEPLLAGIVSAG